MSENEEAIEKAMDFTTSLNRFLSIGAGLSIIGSVIYTLSMTESPLHPSNNLEFGAFLTVLGIAGLYWLITGIKPGLKISEYFS